MQRPLCMQQTELSICHMLLCGNWFGPSTSSLTGLHRSFCIGRKVMLAKSTMSWQITSQSAKPGRQSLSLFLALLIAVNGPFCRGYGFQLLQMTMEHLKLSMTIYILQFLPLCQVVTLTLQRSSLLSQLQALFWVCKWLLTTWTPSRIMIWLFNPPGKVVLSFSDNKFWSKACMSLDGKKPEGKFQANGVANSLLGLRHVQIKAKEEQRSGCEGT